MNKKLLPLYPCKPYSEPVKSLTNSFSKSYFAFLITALLTLSLNQQAHAVMADHMAVLDLVPLSSMNREVIQSGSWSDPATWNDGILPQAGENIYVPADKSLLVDISSDVNLNTIRVDGIIQFSTDKNVSIKLDTLVVTQTGTFEIGSESSRVPDTNKISIIIANNGPINRIWDPTNVSRGVILQGKTRIFGAEKSAYHALSVKPGKGATQIQLDTIPTGWANGDIIAITSTEFREKKPSDTSYKTEDELRRIKNISGNIITLGSVIDQNTLAPLQYSHDPIIERMPVYAANLTRNIEFTGEGGDSIPNGERGHFMVMHTPDTVIKGAGFYHFGRTDKSVPLNDFKLDANEHRLVDNLGRYIPDVNTNPRGRYPVHFHHAGTDIRVPPAICSGNAVISSPGWGFVNHTSNVIMENNASFDVYGSHFASEDGNELGAFRHNIAIKSEGRTATIKTGTGNHDLGHTGHGFWLESRNLSVEDNVVSGVSSAGIVYFHRIGLNGINTEIPKANLLTPNKGIVKNLPTIRYSNVPIVDHKNMTVLASGLTLSVIKSSNDQGHDVRNMIESLKGYSVAGGLTLSYTGKYTFTDLELVACQSSGIWKQGFNVTKNDRDIAIINASISGFVHPIVTGGIFHGVQEDTEIVFSNVSVDGRPFNPLTDIHQPTSLILSNYNPQFHHVVNSPNLNVLNFTPSSSTSYDISSSSGDYTVFGLKTDSLGKIAFESKWRFKSLVSLISRGYYTRPDGSKFIILTDIIANRLNGKTTTTNTRLNLVGTFKYLGKNLGVLPN